MSCSFQTCKATIKNYLTLFAHHRECTWTLDDNMYILMGLGTCQNELLNKIKVRKKLLLT